MPLDFCSIDSELSCEDLPSIQPLPETCCMRAILTLGTRTDSRERKRHITDTRYKSSPTLTVGPPQLTFPVPVPISVILYLPLWTLVKSSNAARSRSRSSSRASERTSDRCERNAAKGSLRQVEDPFQRTSVDYNLPSASFFDTQSSPSPRSVEARGLPGVPIRRQSQTNMGPAAPMKPTRHGAPAPPPPAKVPKLPAEASTRSAQQRVVTSPAAPVCLPAVPTPTNVSSPRHTFRRSDAMPAAHEKEEQRATPPLRSRPATHSAPQHATTAIQAKLATDIPSVAHGTMPQDLVLALLSPSRRHAPAKQDTASVRSPRSAHRMLPPLPPMHPESRPRVHTTPATRPARADSQPRSQPPRRHRANAQHASELRSAAAPHAVKRHFDTPAFHASKSERTFVARAIQTEDEYHVPVHSTARVGAAEASRPSAGHGTNNAQPLTADNIARALQDNADLQLNLLQMLVESKRTTRDYALQDLQAGGAESHRGTPTTGTAPSLSAFLRGLHQYTKDHGNSQHQAVRFVKGFKESLYAGSLAIASSEDRELFLEVLRGICSVTGHMLIAEGGTPGLFGTWDRKQPTNTRVSEAGSISQPPVTSGTTVGPTPIVPSASAHVMTMPGMDRVPDTPLDCVQVAVASSLKKAGSNSPKKIKKRKTDPNENQTTYGVLHTAPASTASAMGAAPLSASSKSGVQAASSGISASAKSPKRKSAKH